MTVALAYRGYPRWGWNRCEQCDRWRLTFLMPILPSRADLGQMAWCKRCIDEWEPNTP